MPHTNPHATLQRHRKGLDTIALCVGKARTRNSAVGGRFEVADAENPFTYEDGSLTVQVKCRWYGLRTGSQIEWMLLGITNALNPPAFAEAPNFEKMEL